MRTAQRSHPDTTLLLHFCRQRRHTPDGRSVHSPGRCARHQARLRSVGTPGGTPPISYTLYPIPCTLYRRFNGAPVAR